MMDLTVAELMATIAHALNEEHPDTRWRVSGGKDPKSGTVTIIASSIPDDEGEEKEQDDTNRP